jgi:hypothetical protein
MTIIQHHERARLEALLRELRPIEARCVPMSAECLRAIEKAKEVEDEDE